MVYKVIGLMSGSSLDGLDIVFAEIEENAGSWNFNIIHSQCIEYESALKNELTNATLLNALEYQLLHTSFGHYLGRQVVDFIKNNSLEHQVHFIASHGHTTFHLPGQNCTHQLGDGASIAGETGLPVITDLRALDIALGGQGAPVVPIGEKLLFPQFDIFLNIGGIANISFKTEKEFIGFDICPANKILNLLAEQSGHKYDDEGKLSSGGLVNEQLLNTLNELDYYHLNYPKSLANSFGIDHVYPLIKSFSLSDKDSLATYVEHISMQVMNAVKSVGVNNISTNKLFITGGGALNIYLIKRIAGHLEKIGIEVYLPAKEIINYKEALIIALMGALRWREQTNVMKSVTGANRDSIGGALWLGAEG